MTDTPTNALPADPDFWKRKLLAFLHDPPAKPFDLWRHGDDADRFRRQAGLLDEEFNKVFDAQCDHMAAAADRFPFPAGQPSGLHSSFTGGKDSPFLHPLGGSRLVFDEPFPSAGVANAPFDATQPGERMYDRSAIEPELRDWANFFLHWRLWPEFAADAEPRASFIPADTRLPDHTVWNHMALTSAIYSATRDGDHPAFLIFQLGPVQDFISQARSCRDLLSGSYLISWLTAHAIKAVTDQVGPDCVIMPSLRGLALFDALHRESLFDRLAVQEKDGLAVTLWSRLAPCATDLLTPNLPNRFVALVPACRGRALADSATQAANAELERIAEHVWPWVAETAAKAGCPDAAGWKARWQGQVNAFLHVTWQVSPVELDLARALEQFASLPGAQVGEDGRTPPAQALRELHRLATELIPQEHRDRRFFESGQGATGRLSNPAFAWASWHGTADFALAARRNTRDFAAWPGEPATKDSLAGKEEMIGTPAFWEYLQKKEFRDAPEREPVFKGKAKPLGAINLIKRLWCHPALETCYLRTELRLRKDEYAKAIAFDDTREIANRNANGGPYLAVLALDGDSMGQWLSGAKTPPFRDCLSAGAREYFDALARANPAVASILNVPRPLFPSYHLQFSEALTNFSRHLARPVVEAFKGQLVYSGGDDVLALIPADRALACAEALRLAFRGEALPAGVTDIGCVPGCPGFLRFQNGHARRIFAVPGPAADVSVGIAVGHYMAPLQMLVREAQKAEKTAKGTYGRGALAVSLYKRSGEIIEWGCKWDNGAERVALQLMRRVTALSSGEGAALSGRFPYALAELLAPYRLERPAAVDPSALCEIIRREFAHVVAQQGSELKCAQREELLRLADLWLTQTAPRLQDFVELFLVETFINRPRGED